MTPNTSKNLALAEKLRRDNPEQFQTLVRMHLSFVLDLHTDENDATNEKSKLKKWSFAHFAKKPKSQIKGVMEGAPLTQEGICQVYQLIEYLSLNENLCEEGIFRRTGSLIRQQELRGLLNAGKMLSLDSGRYSVHDCASVLKGFLAELPEPLLMDAFYPIHCQIAELCSETDKTNESRLLNSLQLLFQLLPPENRVLLKDLLQLLNQVASHEKNKMSADSLATLFTPHLICPRKLSPEALHMTAQTMSGIVSFMIKKNNKLFEIPLKLATDIKVYYEKKKARTPQKELNESISDSTAANTVFSFVDRERTAQANNSNPTEAALAQLYAHIQSLPESSKKRKLIKQCNRQNGQGTPLQIQRSEKKDLNSKSLGDSIKRHIFQKNLNKTVKKSSDLNSCMLSGAYVNNDSTSANTPDSKHTLPKMKLFIEEINCLKSYDTKNDTLNLANQIKSDSTDQLASVIKSDEPVGLLRTNDVNSFVYKESGGLINESNSKDAINCDSSIDSVSYEKQEPAWSGYLTSTPAGQCLQKTVDNKDKLFTPHCMTGRKSMSPITRSANRMSKAMQETMMTPRSRKPVLLISATNICKLAASNNKNILHKDAKDRSCTNIVEQDETCMNADDSFLENCKTDDESFIESTESLLESKDTNTSTNETEYLSCSSSKNDHSFIDSPELKNNTSGISELCDFKPKTTTFARSKSEGDYPIHKTQMKNNLTDTPESLTDTFREYLLSRSVLTTSLTDSSFSSRTDDFDSTSELNISENKLSKSLLFCLDGNKPPSTENSVLDNSQSSNLLPIKKRSLEKENIDRNLIFKLRKYSDSTDVFETSL